jgi:hypothetical protein
MFGGEGVAPTSFLAVLKEKDFHVDFNRILSEECDSKFSTRFLRVGSDSAKCSDSFCPRAECL